eukprot:366519-Chlamydomonas_euryale.AAC.29
MAKTDTAKLSSETQYPHDIAKSDTAELSAETQYPLDMAKTDKAKLSCSGAAAAQQPCVCQHCGRQACTGLGTVRARPPTPIITQALSTSTAVCKSTQRGRIEAGRGPRDRTGQEALSNTHAPSPPPSPPFPPPPPPPQVRACKCPAATPPPSLLQLALSGLQGSAGCPLPLAWLQPPLVRCVGVISAAAVTAALVLAPPALCLALLPGRDAT